MWDNPKKHMGRILAGFPSSQDPEIVWRVPCEMPEPLRGARDSDPPSAPGRDQPDALMRASTNTGMMESRYVYKD